MTLNGNFVLVIANERRARRTALVWRADISDCGCVVDLFWDSLEWRACTMMQ